MNIQFLTNGNIEMTADRACQKRIKRLLKFTGGSTYAAEAFFLADELQCRRGRSYTPMQQTAPCSVGALTSAPMITDDIAVWAYMDYQVLSFLEELAKGEKVIWTKG